MKNVAVPASDPGWSGGGPRNMKYKGPSVAAIFFMTSFNRDRGGHGSFSPSFPVADPGGGGQGGHDLPLSLLKLVIKKMAAIGGPLYFMFLGPSPLLTMLDPMLLSCRFKSCFLLSFPFLAHLAMPKMSLYDHHLSSSS